jgi:putative two-component system response regulator
MSDNTEKKKILLVDDDEIQHLIIENMLNDEYEIFKAKSGNEALKFFYNKSVVIDLVLLDILMPEIDGWEVFNRIRALSLLKKAPMAFITSVNEPAEEKKAFDMGAADFIRKPYEQEDLKNRIKNIFDKAAGKS